MSATTFVLFYRTTLGLLIGDLSWDFCKKVSDGQDVSTIGCTLEPLGVGRYLLINPNITEDTVYSLHVTSDPLQYSDGLFVITDYAKPSDIPTATINTVNQNVSQLIFNDTLMSDCIHIGGLIIDSLVVTPSRLLEGSEIIIVYATSISGYIPNQIELGRIDNSNIWTQTELNDIDDTDYIIRIDAFLLADANITVTGKVQSGPDINQISASLLCPLGTTSCAYGNDGKPRGVGNYRTFIPASESTLLSVQTLFTNRINDVMTSELIGGINWTSISATWSDDYYYNQPGNDILIYASNITYNTDTNIFENLQDVLLGTINANGTFTAAGSFAPFSFNCISIANAGQISSGVITINSVAIGAYYLRIDHTLYSPTRLYLVKNGWSKLNNSNKIITDHPAYHTSSLSSLSSWTRMINDKIDVVPTDSDFNTLINQVNNIHKWVRNDMVAAGQIKWSSISATLSTNIPEGIEYKLYYNITNDDTQYLIGHFDNTGWHKSDILPDELSGIDDFTAEPSIFYLGNEDAVEPPLVDTVIPACTLTISFNRWGVDNTLVLPVPARVYGPNMGTAWCLLWNAQTKIPVMWGAGPIWTGNVGDDDFQSEVLSVLDQFSATTDLFSVYVEDQNNDPVSTMRMEIWLNDNRVKTGTTAIDGTWDTGGLPVGDYTIRGFLVGYEFEDQTITLPATTITLVAIKNTIPVAPPTPDSVTLYGYVIDTDGQPIQNALIDASLTGTSSVFIDGSAVGNRTTALTNRFGYFEMTLVKDVPMIIKCTNVNFYKKHTFAADDSVVDWQDIP